MSAGLSKIPLKDVTFVATKVLTADIKQTLQSQKIELNYSEGNLASVTSLV